MKPGSMMNLKKTSTKMPNNSADTATKKQHTARAKNKSELQTNQ